MYIYIYIDICPYNARLPWKPILPLSWSPWWFVGSVPEDSYKSLGEYVTLTIFEILNSPGPPGQGIYDTHIYIYIFITYMLIRNHNKLPTCWVKF